MASTASCLQLHKRAERVAAALMGRLNTGDHVALVYPPGTRQTATVLLILSVLPCRATSYLHCHCLQFFLVVILMKDESEALSEEDIIVLTLHISVQEST